jgi:hypothetical protein
MLALNREREPTPRERKFRIAREAGRVCTAVAPSKMQGFKGRSVSAWTKVHTNGDLTLVDEAGRRNGDPPSPVSRIQDSNSSTYWSTASVRTYGPTSPRLSDVSIPVRPPVTGVSPEWPELVVVNPTDLPTAAVAAPLMAHQPPNCTKASAAVIAAPRVKISPAAPFRRLIVAAWA